MVSIIVFSKGRPMQMHAYLESLLKFSDARQEMVTVLYCETEGIRYGKLMQQFPKVTWRKENKFETDLKQIIADAGEYIMFGCDDVVFTRPFSLQKAREYLRAHGQSLGTACGLAGISDLCRKTFPRMKRCLNGGGTARCSTTITHGNWTVLCTAKRTLCG